MSRRIQSKHLGQLLVAALLVHSLGGCSRRFYRTDADAQVNSILRQKEAHETYALPYDLTVYPDPRARFFDPTDPDCPRLPQPLPLLNSYPLPPLISGDPDLGSESPQAEHAAGGLSGGDDAVPDSGGRGPDGSDAPVEDVLPAPADAALGQEQSSAAEASIRGDIGNVELATMLQPVSKIAPPDERGTGSDGREEEIATESRSPDGATSEIGEDDSARDGDDAGTLRIAAIPADTWEDIPEVCLPRMLEFESIRQEYERTFKRKVPRQLTSDAPRLTLPNIMELALINSREYQTRKEVLYQVALRLTRERYEFLLKPTSVGNGTEANFQSLNVDGRQVNRLGVPTQAAVTQTMATGGQFLASFANNVLLTFNGPQGFAADVNSELLFDFQQTIFQRDIVFEGLTQAERDVIYASRDFIRYRRQLFRDLARQYYNLLLSYRAIEIASQDYFSNLRGFLQSQAEYELASKLPRVQVDQFEQNALRSRSDLVSRCNQLETALDQLKLAIGLPPEMPLNLALDELETLTAGDEWTVARELVSRIRRELLSQQQHGRGGATALVNAANVLADRIGDIQRLSRELQSQTGTRPDSDAAQEAEKLRHLSHLLGLLEAEARADVLRDDLRSMRETAVEFRELQIYNRVTELIEAVTSVAGRSIDYIEAEGSSEEAIPTAQAHLRSIRRRARELEDSYRVLAPTEKIDQLPQILEQAERLLGQAERLAAELSRDLIPEERDAYLAFVERTVAETLQLADEAISGSDAGLADVEVEEDPAMLTALVNRLDLMNRRGELSDSRRAIKLAGDDLRSVLDLRATQILRTPTDANQPFDFGFDNSETRLSIALDTPLNRRVQRNNYRVALISYNRAIRELIDAEDGIKFSVRDDLRRLRLRRNQYEIGIKSAALAYERVVSTRLQLQLARGNVVARDFLEAQQAYTAALSRVASEHIAFILDRVELFYDLEAIRLDQIAYWPGLQDEEMQPPTDLNFPANNPHPYGTLPPRLHYSDEVRQTVR